MHPWERLQRRFPGEGLGDPSHLGEVLLRRDAPLPAEAPRAGQTVKVPDASTRAAQKLGKTAPNAPLLKRLVRYPYQMSGSKGKRAVWREGVPWSDLAREARLAPLVVVRRERDPVVMGSPLRGFERRPAREARLSVESWLGSRGGAA